MERHKAVDAIGHLNGHTFEGDLMPVHRHAIERGAMARGKPLELIQRSFVIEHLCITLDGIGRVEDASAAAGGLLALAGVGSGIRAEEKACVTTGGSPAQGQTMPFPFNHREAVEVAAQSIEEHRVAIDLQVVRCDCGREIAICGTDEVNRLFCCDVFENDAQLGMTFLQRSEMTLNEDRFTIENIHIGIGHLPMDQQGHADTRHAGEDRIDPIQTGHASR
jgi:hypothetical protein